MCKIYVNFLYNFLNSVTGDKNGRMDYWYRKGGLGIDLSTMRFLYVMRMFFKFSGKIIVDIISGIGIISYLFGRIMLDFYFIVYVLDRLKNKV